MNDEQFARLKALETKLVDVALVDADPETWVGFGLKPNEMTKEERGNAYWCRRQAVATFSLLNRLQVLTDTVYKYANRGAIVPDESEGDLLDAEIKAAEKEGAALLEKLQRQKKKHDKLIANGKK